MSENRHRLHTLPTCTHRKCFQSPIISPTMTLLPSGGGLRLHGPLQKGTESRKTCHSNKHSKKRIPKCRSTNSLCKIFTNSALHQNKDTKLVIQNNHPSTQCKCRAVALVSYKILRLGPRATVKAKGTVPLSAYLLHRCLCAGYPRAIWSSLPAVTQDESSFCSPRYEAWQIHLSCALLWLVCKWYQSQQVKSHRASLHDTAVLSWHNSQRKIADTQQHSVLLLKSKNFSVSKCCIILFTVKQERQVSNLQVID